MKYVKVEERHVPRGVRFDVTRASAGQMIQIAYSGFDRHEHGDGDRFKMVTDRSLREASYYIAAPWDDISQERGREIADGVLRHHGDGDDATDEERKAIKKLWAYLPGWLSFYDVCQRLAERPVGERVSVRDIDESRRP